MSLFTDVFGAKWSKLPTCCCAPRSSFCPRFLEDDPYGQVVKACSSYQVINNWGALIALLSFQIGHKLAILRLFWSNSLFKDTTSYCLLWIKLDGYGSRKRKQDSQKSLAKYLLCEILPWPSLWMSGLFLAILVHFCYLPNNLCGKCFPSIILLSFTLYKDFRKIEIKHLCFVAWILAIQWVFEHWISNSTSTYFDILILVHSNLGMLWRTSQVRIWYEWHRRYLSRLNRFCSIAGDLIVFRLPQDCSEFWPTKFGQNFQFRNAHQMILRWRNHTMHLGSLYVNFWCRFSWLFTDT